MFKCKKSSFNKSIYMYTYFSVKKTSLENLTVKTLFGIYFAVFPLAYIFFLNIDYSRAFSNKRTDFGLLLSFFFHFKFRLLLSCLFYCYTTVNKTIFE